MTRKDFVLIAETLGRIRHPGIRSHVISLFVPKLCKQNPNFDSQRFIDRVEKTAGELPSSK